MTMVDKRCSYHKRKSCISSSSSSPFPLGPAAVLLISTMYIALIHPPLSNQGPPFVHGLLPFQSRKGCRHHATYYFKNPSHEGEDHHAAHLTESPSSASTTSLPLPPRAASELFKRKKLKSKKKKSTDGGKLGQPVTENDIVQHVASKYVTGPGGVLYTSDMKRKKTEAAHSVATTNLFEMDTNKEGQYSDFLKKLDRHPALVLNANYQV